LERGRSNHGRKVGLEDVVKQQFADLIKRLGLCAIRCRGIEDISIESFLQVWPRPRLFFSQRLPLHSISGYRIPIWTLPLMMTLVVSFLIPNTSLLGHLCALAIGYLCKSI
jgi:hypothetical protein